MRLAWAIALREMRGGIAGFRVFLICLILGVAAIASVGMVRDAITRALAGEGRSLLGGDAQIEFTYRTARPEERAWMEGASTRLSEVLEFRSMLRAGSGENAQFALTQVKAVDGLWPMVGAVQLDPPMPVADALGVRGGLPGAVMEKVLADRLGLRVGDELGLGDVAFRLSAILMRQPDDTSAGFSLAPKTVVASSAIASSSLTAPGSVFDAEYRMILPEGHDLDATRAAAEAHFAGSGIRWQDSRAAAPGLQRNIDRIGSFLILLGLSGLTVGGVGIATATHAWITRKTATIATLKAIGATSALVTRVFVLQLSLLAAVGIALGLILGMGLPMAFAPLLTRDMPIELMLSPSTRAMAEAAVYGALIAMIAVLVPVSRMTSVKPAILYRASDAGRSALPKASVLAAALLLALLLVAAAVLFSGEAVLALSTLGGIALALVVLWLVAQLLRRVARRLATAGAAQGRPALRAALAAIGGPKSDVAAVVLSLGLGLCVLATVGQVQSNMQRALSRELPQTAPAYFVIDIQPDQIGPMQDRLARMPEVERVQTAPMLRGVITQINGQDALTVAGDHWVLRGDRGVTYADRPPNGTEIVAGQWWPEDYSGRPQASVAADEAAELGLKLGDRLTVNILGRDIEAEITSFRQVDYRADGIGFFLLLNAGALAGAPHTNIATIYAAPAAEAGILRDIANEWPNITAIPVRDAIARFSEAVGAISRAAVLAAGVTLATGFVVLIGAAASGEQARSWEAAILKVLGASRSTILASFALRAALTGAAAGIFALAFGAAAGWALMYFVIEAPYRFAVAPALGVVIGGALATLVAGLFFALRPLARRPAGVLSAVE